MTPTDTNVVLNTLALLGPYAPGRSALAGYTKRLRDALVSTLGESNTMVLAVDDRQEGLSYAENVRMHIYAKARKNFQAAADFLNINRIDLCIIQHTFDLYGGDEGRFLLIMVRCLRMPILCTLHEVPAQPTSEQKEIIRELARLCDRIIVTTQKDKAILTKTCKVRAKKLALIGPGLGEAASKKTTEAMWQETAKCYLDVARDIVRRRKHRPHTDVLRRLRRLSPDLIPDIDLKHLKTLTDATGIIQHATYTVPNRQHGYTTDDNARAIVAALMYHDLRKDPSVLPLARTYLSFIHDAFNPTAKRFRNFMGYNRTWLEEVGSEDAHGRVLWALGLAVVHAPDNGVLAFATRLFNEALPPVERFDSPRAWAFAIIGIQAYLRRFSGDVNARRVRKTLAERLFAQFQENRADDWPWCEDSLTYGNAKLPHALILAGQWLPNKEMLSQGLDSLEWLLEIQTTEESGLSLIGNNGWLDRSGQRAHFDQQPIEVMALIDALTEAHQATGRREWAEEAFRCLGWFLGQNDTGAMLYDPKTGGCRDGLQPDGPNNNEGAESTLAWLISLTSIHELLASGFAPSSD
ncbi:MAG: hypothetical protein GXP25_20940 [Planctomycetes bacterium]|nr:hypothetical protein [Planctomycetota bacterium]